MLNIKLVGAFGERNFGDDLLLASTAKLLGDVPLGRLGVAATDPARATYIKRIVPHADVVERVYAMPGRWDAEIFAGGNQFYSFPQRDGQLAAGAGKKTGNNKTGGRATARGTHVEPRGAWERISERVRAEGLLRFTARHTLRRLLPKPHGFAVGIGIGPFECGNEDESRRVVEGLDHIWIRDERSKSDLARWGLTNYGEGADLCFASAALTVQPRASSARIRSVGVVVRGWDYETPAADYLQAVRSFAAELREQGIAVRFYAFCAPADQQVIAALLGAGEPISVWNPDAISIEAFLGQLSGHDLMLSARFHGVVIAALLGIPTIGLSVDPKVRGICARLGVGDFVWDGTFSLRELRKTFQSAGPHLRTMRQHIDAAVQRERVKADAMVAELTTRLAAL